MKVGRRGFLAALASLPFLARPLPEPALPETPVGLRGISDDGTSTAYIFMPRTTYLFSGTREGWAQARATTWPDLPEKMPDNHGYVVLR